jgi:hypothetical protein
MLNRVARFCKNIVLPPGPKYRKIAFGPAAGCTMQVDFRSQTRTYLGLYEFELNKYFRSMVRPGFGSFDVGGQGGYDALMLAKLSGGGRVVSFECDAAAAVLMRATFARNPYPIGTIQAFVGKSEGEGKTTLDAVAAQTFTPDFIKLDIECAELDALRGAQEILSTQKPSLIVETHSKELEAGCIELLRSHGYEPKIVDQRRWFPDHRTIPHNRWLVCEGRS